MEKEFRLPEKYLGSRNAELLGDLLSKLSRRPDRRLPGMGVFYGPTGYGKTSAISFCANTHRPYHIRPYNTWTRRDLLEAVLGEMGIAPATRLSHMLSQIGKQLDLSGRPLIIDEADILISRGMIEILRDICDISQGVLVLVGEEGLPAMLEKTERVYGRVYDWKAAVPANMSDARLFAAHYCRGIPVSDELLERILEASAGSARLVCKNLSHAAEFALLNDLEALSLATYAEPLFTGRAPERRKRA
jgi:hypothetical protein